MTAESASLLEQAKQHFNAADLVRARTLCEQSVALDPANAESHNLLGLIAARQSDCARAVQHFAAAAELQPASPVIQNNLGAAYMDLADYERALAAFGQAIRHFPGYAVAHKNLGRTCHRLGRFEQAAASFKAALNQNPKYAPAHIDWADMLYERGDLPAAARHYQQAVELEGSPDARIRLAQTLDHMGHHQRAAELYREVEAGHPDFPGLHNNLGQTLFQLGEVDEAIEYFQAAIAAEGAGPVPANSLGNAYSKLGRPDEAIRCFRQALEIRPDYATAHSNLLLNFNYVGIPQQESLREARNFAARQYGRITGRVTAWSNPPETDRGLRIGYVSGDFRSHSCAYYLLPLLRNHDRQRFAVYCYSNNPREDAMTDEFRSLTDHWVSVRGVSDEQVAGQIRADQLDVLVDLAGHTAANRLGIFARRAAPVQVSWLGYPNTTGLETIDYRITDDIADPEADGGDTGYTETLYRLPGCFVSYSADARSCPVSTAPSVSNGWTTFGSFNMLAKVTPEVVALWAKVLQAVPESRLLLKAQSLGHEVTSASMRSRFAEHGIDAARLELTDMVSKEAHYKMYSRVDIALDTFPYNGTTTTCEALWMGVPVITLRGTAHAGRVGASLLQQAGMAEFIANDQACYVGLAQSLAADRQRLADLRASLRSRMQQSALMDEKRFTARMEDAYRKMWTKWCASQR